MRSARGSSGLWTGWPKPGRRRLVALASATISCASPPWASSFAQSSAVPKITGPQPRMPAATAPWRLPGSAASVIRAATLVGIIPCSASEISSRSRKSRWSSVGSSPVSSRWKYSVKLRRPIRSPVRSRPRTSTRSAWAWLMLVTGSPDLPIMRARRRYGTLVAASSTWRERERQPAQQPCQAVALGGAQALQQPHLVGHVGLRDAVDPLVAGLGERDDHAAAVVGVWRALGQAGALEPVQALGGARGGEHQRAGEVRGAQLVRRPRAAQRGQHVVPARLEAVLAVDGLQPRLQLARESRDPAHHADRRVVELGPLAPPLLDDLVDAVGLGHGGNPIGRRFVARSC